MFSKSVACTKGEIKPIFRLPMVENLKTIVIKITIQINLVICLFSHINVFLDYFCMFIVVIFTVIHFTICKQHTQANLPTSLLDSCTCTRADMHAHVLKKCNILLCLVEYIQVTWLLPNYIKHASL